MTKAEKIGTAAALGDAPRKAPKGARKAGLARIMERHDTLAVEMENWLDGQKVESEGQMLTVEALLGDVKTLKADLEAAKEKKYRPIKTKLDAVVAEFAPSLKDCDRWRKGLIAIVSDFKAELKRQRDAEAAAAKRKADEAARLAQLEQERASQNAGDLEAQRRADEVAAQARQIEREAQAIKREGAVKGLRTHRWPEITDRRAVLAHVAQHDPAALEDFLARWVSVCFSKSQQDAASIPGVTIREEQRAI